MITEQDLRQAIAECQGERNPNANTCIKLAAYYTILNQMTPEYLSGYSGDASPGIITYESDTEFGKTIAGKSMESVFPVIDELMETLKVMNSRLYGGVLRRLSSRE